jgi:hypothetical protein
VRPTPGPSTQAVTAPPVAVTPPPQPATTTAPPVTLTPQPATTTAPPVTLTPQPATTTAPAPTPPVNAAATVAVTPTPTAEVASAVDRTGIEDLFAHIKQAYRRKDINSIKQLYPRAPYNFKGCKEVDVDFGTKQIDPLSDGVLVRTTSLYTCVPDTRQPKQSTSTPDTFKLEKRGGSWVVVELLVPVGK